MRATEKVNPDGPPEGERRRDETATQPAAVSAAVSAADLAEIEALALNEVTTLVDAGVIDASESSEVFAGMVKQALRTRQNDAPPTGPA